MRNVWTIASREYRHYFLSPVAYIVAFLILMLAGTLFVFQIQRVQSYIYQGYYPPAPTAANSVIYPTAFMMLFAAPALTMRLLSEEHRSGTIELLLTAPVKDWELVVGKWLGALLYMLTVFAITLIIPIVLNRLVEPGIDVKATLAGYIGLILLTAAFLAIGTAFSAMFNNQFAAFFATLIMIVILWWVVGWPANAIQSAAGFFTYLHAYAHLDSLLQGSIALEDIVYFLSLTVVGLFVGTVAIEIRRWQ